MRGRQAALRWGLERAAVRILGDVTSLVVDDRLHKRCELLVLGKERVVMGELVCSVSQPLCTAGLALAVES